MDRTRTLRGALAGAVAAGVWLVQQPLDKRRVRLAVRRRRAARPADRHAMPSTGAVLHLGNGALFGAVYSGVAPATPLPREAARPGRAASLEHLATWPLTARSSRRR